MSLMIARTFLKRQGEAQERKVDTLIGIADAVFQAQRAAAPRHAHQRPAGVHAGGLSLGLRRR